MNNKAPAKFKKGDKFILIKSGRDCDDLFDNEPWGKEFEVTHVLDVDSTYGQLYRCQGYTVADMFMETPETHTSPLYQALL